MAIRNRNDLPTPLVLRGLEAFSRIETGVDREVAMEQGEMICSTLGIVEFSDASGTSNAKVIWVS